VLGLGVVAKVSDLNGLVSSSQGLREILFQVEQCFDVPFLLPRIKLLMNKIKQRILLVKTPKSDGSFGS
jgi:hypothetical protein